VGVRGEGREGEGVRGGEEKEIPNMDTARYRRERVEGKGGER
jgi:hypothetical protein